MRVNDIVRAFEGHFDLERLDMKALRRLQRSLVSAGYTESAIYEALDIQYFNMITLFNLPIFLDFKLREQTPFNKIVKLFLLSQSIERQALLEGLFDEEDLESLKRMSILSEADGMIRASIDIFPCMGIFIATDHHFTEDKSPRAVMFLGKDSYTLARGTIRKPVSNTLDLCTGSGVQALLAASHSGHVIGVDINPRAVNFANFNRIFNEICNVTFLEGDLFEPVKGETFDLVIANPPFVPSSERRAKVFFRDGGFTGETILEKILGALDHALSEHGTCQIITQLLFRGTSDYVDHLSCFLGRKALDILVLASNNQTVELFVMGHLKYFENFADYRKDVKEWLQCHYDNRISEVAEGLIAISRTPKGSRSAGTLVSCRFPNYPFSHKIEEYLERLREAGREEELSRIYPVINEEVKCLWEGRENGSRNGIIVEFADEGVLLEKRLSPLESFLLRKCNGKTRAGKIASAYAGEVLPEMKKSLMEECYSAFIGLAKKQIIRFSQKSQKLHGIAKGIAYILLCTSEETFEMLLMLQAALV
jgi:carbamoyltransferase